MSICQPFSPTYASCYNKMRAIESCTAEIHTRREGNPVVSSRSIERDEATGFHSRAMYISPMNTPIAPISFSMSHSWMRKCDTPTFRLLSRFFSGVVFSADGRDRKGLQSDIPPVIECFEISQSSLSGDRDAYPSREHYRCHCGQHTRKIGQNWIRTVNLSMFCHYHNFSLVPCSLSP